MKKVNPAEGKLQLRKQALVNLSKSETEQVQGGKAILTTSWSNCTDFLCCSPTPSNGILQDGLDRIGGDHGNGTGSNPKP